MARERVTGHDLPGPLAVPGHPPWQPSPQATNVDVWDKYDFPLCGTYRLGDELVFFEFLSGNREKSLWRYVLIPPGEREAVTEARFESTAEFDAFIDRLFTGSEERQARAHAVSFLISEILDHRLPLA